MKDKNNLSPYVRHCYFTLYLLSSSNKKEGEKKRDSIVQRVIDCDSSTKIYTYIPF